MNSSRTIQAHKKEVFKCTLDAQVRALQRGITPLAVQRRRITGII